MTENASNVTSPLYPPWNPDSVSTENAPITGQPQAPASPLISGLSGGQPPAPSAAPAEEPKPEQSFARHVLYALGGSGGRPGDAMKSILAGALTGMAGAANAPAKPGAPVLAGVGAGAGAEINAQKQAQARQDVLKQQDVENKQKQAKLDSEQQEANARVASYNAQTASSIMSQQRIAGEIKHQNIVNDKEADELDQLQTQHEQMATAQIGLLKSAGLDMSKYPLITNTADLTSDQKAGIMNHSLIMVDNGEKHEEGEDGVGVHLIPVKDVRNLQTTKDMTIPVETYDAKGNPTTEQVPIAHGQSVETAMQAYNQQKQKIQDRQKNVLDAAKQRQEQEQATAGLAKTKADTSKANADANKANREAAQLSTGPSTDSLGATITPPAGGVKEANKIRDSFKKDADNLAKTEGTFNQFQDVLNDINSGKDVTGAQSVVALFNAIGISAEPLQGKGFRINHSTVEEHSEARGLGEGLYQKLLKLKNGDVITPQQIKDYASIASRSRHDAYVNKINEVRAQGVSPDFLLPRGNGRTIDSNTASIFYDAAAGNNPVEKSANAQKAAKQAGWNF
jgi:hypothetical protein